MRAQAQAREMVPIGENPKPKGSQKETGKERSTDDNTQRAVKDDDNGMPNPLVGSMSLETLMVEGNSMSLRKTSYMATWNLQGLTSRKLAIIEKEIERCNIDILGFAESWWLGEGRFMTENKNIVFFSGRPEGRRSSGVGFIVKSKLKGSVMGYSPVNDRVITIRLSAKPVNLTIVQLYAPTCTAPNKEIDSFYDIVQDMLDSIPNSDIILLMGDLNAKIGKVAKKSSNSGIYGIGAWNEMGNRLEEFCQANDLVIGNTTFKHTPRILYTSVSPGDRIRNQIDYLMEKRRRRSLPLGVKTRPRADFGSDHHLLNAKIKIRLRTRKTINSPIRYDVSNIPEKF